MTENRGLSPRMGTLIFTLLVPIPMTGVIPWWITRWRFERPWFGLDWSRGVGACMIVAGAALLLSALAWFAHQGVKPYPPIKRLITTGPYAYTRNPMYTGVILILSGQSLLFGSRALAIYAVCFFTAFVVLEWTIDDPFIKRHIGRPYEDYMRDVPGWIPRRPRKKAPPATVGNLPTRG
jgi:protein-S-isoprenylcysteine O-methyltransferase Ste14